MNRIILTLAGLLLTSACATEPPTQTVDPERMASLQCEYPLTDNNYNYDPYFLANGEPAFDEQRNPNGLSFRGFYAYRKCMFGKGYDISEGGTK